MRKAAFKNFEVICRKFFKDCLPQNLLGTFLNTLTQMEVTGDKDFSWTEIMVLMSYLFQYICFIVCRSNYSTMFAFLHWLFASCKRYPLIFSILIHRYLLIFR